MYEPTSMIRRSKRTETLRYLVKDISKSLLYDSPYLYPSMVHVFTVEAFDHIKTTFPQSNDISKQLCDDVGGVMNDDLEMILND